MRTGSLFKGCLRTTSPWRTSPRCSALWVPSRVANMTRCTCTIGNPPSTSRAGAHCTVTYELASDAAKAMGIFNGKKMFEGGRLTVEMAMVPLHIHAIEASRSRAGPSGSHQTTSKRQQAHWDPPHPHRLPPHLLAKYKENRCDLCLSWSPSMLSILRATTWGGGTVSEWRRFPALTQLTLILVSQDFPPGGSGPSILIERTHLCPKKI